MPKVEIHLRFTVVPLRPEGNRLRFAAYITPVVTSATEMAPVPVPRIEQIYTWPTYSGLPFGSFPSKLGELQVQIGQPAGLKPAEDFQLETDWCHHLSEANPRAFTPEGVLTLWKALVQRAWVAPEKPPANGDPASATQPRATTPVMAAKAPDAPAVAAAATPAAAAAPPAPGAAAAAPKPLEAPAKVVREALERGAHTTESMTSSALNQIAGELVTARALDLPFPGNAPGRREELDDFSFLLSRHERLGSGGKSSQAQEQGNQARAANPDLNQVDPDREFHQLISGLGDHATLLRFLGLIFEFSIKKPGNEILGQPGAGGRQTFAIYLRLKSKGEEVTNGDLTSVVAGDPELPPGATLRGATACQLLAGKYLTPVAARGASAVASSGISRDDLTADARYFEKDRFDTVQWDLIAMLRAALRERDFVPESHAAATGTAADKTTPGNNGKAETPGLAGPPPSPRKPPLVGLTSPGITVFRRDRTAADEVALALTNERLRPGEGFENAYSAQDLVRGYRVEVSRCVQTDETDRLNWSAWKGLTGRQLQYRLDPKGNDHPMTAEDPAVVEKRLIPYFSVEEPASLTLALTEGMQPLSGWILGPVPVRKISAENPDGTWIELSEKEKTALGLKEVDETVSARCYQIATHAGTLIFADVPVSSLQERRQAIEAMQKAVRNDPAIAAANKETEILKQRGKIAPALSNLDLLVHQASAEGQEFLYGIYADLEGGTPGLLTGADDPQISGNGLFLARNVRVLTAEEGFGVAGAVVGEPAARGTDQDTGESQVSLAVETVIRIQRVTEQLPDRLDPKARKAGRNEATFVHLRRMIAPRHAEHPVPISPADYQTWVDALNAAEKATEHDAAKKRAVFIQGQGELALAIPESSRIHLPGFRKSGGGEETGELALEFRGPGLDGRQLFFLADTSGLGSQFLPVNLILPEGLSIQTLTKAEAKASDLAVGAKFRAQFIRAADRTVRLRSLVEVAPAAPAVIRSFDGPEQITLDVPGIPEGLPVAVDPATTIVEIAEAAAAVASAAPTDGFSGSDSGGGGGAGGHFIRGPWAEQALRLQPGDRCMVELLPASQGKARFRVTRLSLTEHDRNTVRVGFFTDAGAIGDREDRFAFRELLPSAPPNGGTPQNPAPPTESPIPVIRQVVIDDSTRMVSGPTMPGQPWRYRQGPPPPGMLAKVFFTRDLSAFDKEKNPGALLQATAVEVLSGLDGTFGFDAETALPTLVLPGFAASEAIGITPARKPFDFLTKEVVEFLKGQPGNVRFVGGAATGVALVGAVSRGAVGRQISETQVEIDDFPGGRLKVSKIEIPDELSAARNNTSDRFSMEVTWSATQEFPTVRILGFQRAVTRLQLSRVDRPGRRLEVMVVFRGEGTAIRPATRTALYLEANKEDDDDPFKFLDPQLDELAASGLPLDYDVDETMVVDAPGADSPATDTEIGRRKLHQYTLFAWPATKQMVSAAPTFVRGEGDPLATVWGERSLLNVFPGTALPGPPEEPKPIVRLAASGSGTQFTPLVDPDRTFTTGAPVLKLPKEVPSFLPDQLVADDAVLHWTGRSLAVGLPGTSGLSEGVAAQDAQPARKNDPLHIGREIPPGEITQLRFGWLYAFRFRPVYLTGDAPPDDPVDDQHSVVFRPFADLLQPVVDRPENFFPLLAHHDLESAKARHSLPFLRLEPLAPPRLGFTSTAQGLEFQKQNGWGDPADVRLLTPGKPGAHCPHKTEKRKAPVLEIHPPESPFRLAELNGVLDDIQRYCGPKAGTSPFNEAAVRRLYRILREFDLRTQDPPPAADGTVTPGPIGQVPLRLPDSDAERVALELRPFGFPDFVRVTASDFQTPDFGIDPCTWVNNGLCNDPIPMRIVPRDPQHETIPPGVPQRAIGDILIYLEKGIITILLPPDADCELTLRSTPAPTSLRHLALARLLEELAAEQTDPPIVSPRRLTRFLDVPKGKIEQAWRDLVAGFHPVLSPGLTVRLRHMTARPARPPEKIALAMAERLPSATQALFDGRYRLDRASTGSLLMQAATEVPYDDTPGTALPRVPRVELERILPEEHHGSIPQPGAGGDNDRSFFGFASDNLRSIIAEDFTISTITPEIPAVIPQTGSEVEQARYRQEFGDTRHHTVFYRPLAVSRFLDFFPRGETNTNPCPGGYPPPAPGKESADEDGRVRWDRVEIPATVRPHAPEIQDQNIVFEWLPKWSDGPESWGRSGEAWVFRRTRFAGVRVWMKRPWYTSGSGETLAVLCWARTRVRKAEIERYLRTVSRWGTDPVFEKELGARTDMGVIVRKDFLHALPDSPAELPVPRTAERPPGASSAGSSAAAAPPPGPATAEDPRLGLAVHQPKFHPEERLWYCDIFIHPRRYTPFVFLSVARYQPFALPECAVSEAVRLDPMQIHPPRTFRVEATVQGTLRLQLEVAGLFPAMDGADQRLILCRVERFTSPPLDLPPSRERLPELGWEEVLLPEPGATPSAPKCDPAKAEEEVRRELSGLPLRRSTHGRETTYQLSFELPRQPGWNENTLLRIAVAEYELFPTAYELTEGRTWAPRLVYADHAVVPPGLMAAFAQTWPV
jgi:hypothetical protein